MSFKTGKKRLYLSCTNVSMYVWPLTWGSVLSATEAVEPKCSLSRVCPHDHFALHIMSGAANVVGPKICFEDKMYVHKVAWTSSVEKNPTTTNWSEM